MGGNKVIAAAVLIVVILGAVIMIVKQQTSSGNVPQWVLDQKHPYIEAKDPFTQKEFRYGDIMDCEVDKATSYRKIESKLWASPMKCASCQKDIPVAPREVKEPKPVKEGEAAPPEEDDFAKPYKCPRCGKEANQEALNQAGKK